MKPDCNDCCTPKAVNPAACGCCEGVSIVTPESTYNRPGLSAINYRIGTHGSFLETMTARLTGYYLENLDDQDQLKKQYPLQGLTTRDGDDPALAMLDAWATVADVLTFYQERIANEGFLRTATERRSVLELARLVGYRPRPGVSSSVFLAYNIDDKFEQETLIPIGSQTQSIPGPDELPQFFETSEDLRARAQWNNLQPRLTRGQTRATITNGVPDSTVAGPRVYLAGVSTNVKPQDVIQIEFSTLDSEVYFVNEVLPDSSADHTLVTFSPQSKPDFRLIPIADVVQNLSTAASTQPLNRLRLARSLVSQFALSAKLSSLDSAFDEANFSPVAQPSYSVLQATSQVFKNKLTKVVANRVTTENQIEVYVLGVKANLFGHNLPAPLPPVSDGPVIFAPVITAVDSDETGLRTLALDAEYEGISIGDRVVVSRGDGTIRKAKVVGIRSQTLGGAQSSGELGFFSTGPTTSTLTTDGVVTTTETEPIRLKVNVLTLDAEWRTDDDPRSLLQTTTIYIQSAQLELAQEPISTSICGGDADEIELDGFYDGLEAGRWVVVTGERDDLSGVRFSELAMLSSVTHGISAQNQAHSPSDNLYLPGEMPHTFIRFAEPLAYCFKRDTVIVHGNVVKATNGETRHEVLGGGDAATPFQSFELKQFPLTHVSASNPSGIGSTLKVLVNDVEWHEADSLAELEENDRKFITKRDNDDKTSVIFGNGKKGARLPSGSENVRAIYRNGIGKLGNVNEEQISLLMSKPLGVKEVINPLRASGGANRETRDQARKHVPLAVKALDRLVSVQDYEDFSRIYAGIGKAHAVEITDGRQQLMHVTVAGAEDIPIDPSSDLFLNLRRALHEFGDPYQVIQLAVRELVFMVFEAGVAILPDYQWESVVTQLRERLLGTFSFERHELGQDVLLSEVIQVMQSVRGVAYVDVNAFGGIPEKIPADAGNIEAFGEERRLLTPDEITDKVADIAVGNELSRVPQRLSVNLAAFEEGIIRPAQIAVLTPEAPATLILNQIESAS